MSIQSQNNQYDDEKYNNNENLEDNLCKIIDYTMINNNFDKIHSEFNNICDIHENK